MDVKRLVDRMDEKKGSVKALHLEVKRTKKKTKKRWKEVLECDMIARGLQRLDAQDRESLQLGCKNCLILHAENICWAPRIEGSTFLEQNDKDE